MSDERRILVGTSGYSFPDWVGPFYPEGTKSSDFLRYYSERFDCVEVNSTYYRVPHPRVLEQMEKKTPPGFRFVVKLNQEMTHRGSRDPALYRDFLAVLEPLKRAEKYDGLLAQFPWGFKRTDTHRRHLEAMRTLLPGEPLFVEFRHDSWLTPQLEPSLRAHHIGFCAVDEPRLQGLLPPVTMLTAEDAYVRFHGRNAQNWWAGSPERALGSGAGARSGDRYDYDYSEAELREWIAKIADLAQQARRTYLFFNNCHAGQAARNAKLMQELLRQQNLPA
ncbi:MAG TPA: DUF72 domain-containing protein [Candidatus Eisenbacteria bacterium]